MDLDIGPLCASIMYNIVAHRLNLLLYGEGTIQSIIFTPGDISSIRCIPCIFLPPSKGPQ